VCAGCRPGHVSLTSPTVLVAPLPKRPGEPLSAAAVAAAEEEEEAAIAGRDALVARQAALIARQRWELELLVAELRGANAAVCELMSVRACAGAYENLLGVHQAVRQVWLLVRSTVDSKVASVKYK
jgi:hypothetical protein